MSNLKKHIKGDPYIWGIVIVLSIIGTLAVYSSSVNLAFIKHNGNTEFYFLRHFSYLLIGLFLLYLAHLIPYKYFSRPAQLFIWLAIGLLALTLVAGSEINNASRVLQIPGLGITFQTSDFAKLALVLYIARYLSKNQKEIGELKTLVRVLGVIAIVVVLIAPENLSTALVIFLTCFFLLYIGRINIKYLAILGFGCLAIIILGATVLLNMDMEGKHGGRMPTWKKRIETFIGDNPDAENYQQMQSKIAVATGGLFGKGPGNSTQRNYLPHPYSDFIFAIIMEEYGWVGGATVIGCFLLLIIRCLKIVNKAPKAFSALVALGLGFSMSFQAFVNMAVAVGIFPVTGLTIPLVSMGGTSLIFNSIAFGMILSVSRADEQEELSTEKNESKS
jgi:cell division protein FtsW